MSTAVFKLPSKTINGNVIMLTLEEWAQLTLSSDDYTTYQAAQVRNDAIMQTAIDASVIVITDLNVSVTDETGNIIITSIGNSITDDVAIPPNDSIWLGYWDQYVADSTLTWPA